MISSRIREIRDYNKMSQREFGERLGVGRDVISNIEYERVELKDPLLSHMCTTFNVDRKWLLTGEGEMINQKTQTNKNSQFAIEILESLTPSLQSFALEQLQSILKLQENDIKSKNNKNNLED